MRIGHRYTGPRFSGGWRDRASYDVQAQLGHKRLGVSSFLACHTDAASEQQRFMQHLIWRRSACLLELAGLSLAVVACWLAKTIGVPR